MAQWLKVLAILPGDLSSIPTSGISQTTACISSSKGCSVSGLLQYMHRHTCLNTHVSICTYK